MRLFWHYFTLVLTFVAGFFIGIKKNGRRPKHSEPSASSTVEKGNNYYVFLSFRGPDTRNGFVDHLYHKLRDVGLPFHPNFVFRDDNDLDYGEDIDENLINAIEHSRVSIPIISETYAASEYCLRELIKIMECKNTIGQVVLPVLYKVKPYEVRALEGKFGEAFESRLHRFKKEDVKKEGPQALKEATALRIFESDKFASGHEAELVNKLIEEIMCSMQHDFPPPLPGDLVGFDNHVTEVMRLASAAPSEIQTIVIHGIGGIGKTTLASFIYKELFDNFDCRSFLKDIRETIQSKGIEHVQSLLISDITKRSASAVRDSQRGINMIRISCQKKKVLILLDDVEREDHLNKLIGGCKFGLGSRIIITCRDKVLLKSEYEEHHLQKMNFKDSLLLFNRYAFEGKEPSAEFVALSSDIVETTGGLPLALVVVGSLLKKKPKSIWIEKLEKLRNVPSEDVQKILRITYDSLGYEEQQMFLDIACFFIGIDKRVATYLWNDLNFSSNFGLKALIDHSSIYVDDNNELRMHDQLRDLGRVIARPVDKKPWDCSRQWGEEAITVQQSKEENRNIEALRLDENGSSMFIKRKSFKRMRHLKYLHLSKVNFVENFKDSLSELRWLEWKMCSDSSEAMDVPLQKLLILDLSGGFISENWQGWSSIKVEKLKVLNLSGCSRLTSTPDLSGFRSLEMLILECCENLEKFHPSIGDVKRLISLNLRYCGSLEKLPEQLDKLENLEELVMDETDIREIPASIGSLEKLKTLSAVGCRLLTRVHSSISRLVSLSTLNLNTCKKLEELPNSFEALGQLQRLLLERCYILIKIPSSIEKLGELVELDLSSTRIEELPDSIGEQTKLKILRISQSEIKKLPSAIGKLTNLQELDASGCHKLKGQILLDKGELCSLRALRLGSAKISHLLEDSHHERSTLKLRELSALHHLDLLYCSELRSLPEPPSSLSSLQLTCLSEKLQSLSHLSHLKKLTLHSCMSLQSIEMLPFRIQELRVWKCPKLKELSNLCDLKYLLELELLQCYGLERLDVEALDCLRKLDLSTSTELSNLNEFEDLESLRYSDPQSHDVKVDNLHEIRGLEKLGSLEVLDIFERKHIQVLDLSKSEHLKVLIVKNCESLVEIRCHSKFLKHFDSNGCKSLKKLPDNLPHDRP